MFALGHQQATGHLKNQKNLQTPHGKGFGTNLLLKTDLINKKITRLESGAFTFALNLFK
jgi:hypothetical protein